jgi:hypothetical protein
MDSIASKLSARTGRGPLSQIFTTSPLSHLTATSSDSHYDNAQQQNKEKVPAGGGTRANDMAARPRRKWTTNSMIGESTLPCRCSRTVLTFTRKAGAGGGLVSSVATCPLDVIKTKLQAQRAIVGQPGYLGIAGTSVVLLFANAEKTHTFV